MTSIRFFEQLVFWVPFLVPFRSPFCSKSGPLLVPFLNILGPLLKWAQWPLHMQHFIHPMLMARIVEKVVVLPLNSFCLHDCSHQRRKSHQHESPAQMFTQVFHKMSFCEYFYMIFASAAIAGPNLCTTPAIIEEWSHDVKEVGEMTVKGAKACASRTL